MGKHVNQAAVTSYVPWASATFTGARVRMTGAPFEYDSDIEIAGAVVADVCRQPSGEVDLLIVCRAGVDPARRQQEITEQLIAAATSTAVLSPIQSAWDAALADYREKWSLWDTLGEGYSDDASNAVATVAIPAIEAMIDTPAPNAAALAIKIEEARRDRREISDDDLDAILADVRRLAELEGR